MHKEVDLETSFASLHYLVRPRHSRLVKRHSRLRFVLAHCTQTYPSSPPHSPQPPELAPPPHLPPQRAATAPDVPWATSTDPSNTPQTAASTSHSHHP